MENYEGIQGPWMIVQDEEYDEIKIVEVEDYQPGFYTEICEIGQSMQEAHLISAAPDLLFALQKLVHLHMCEQEGLSSGQPSSIDWMEAVDCASEAINKALGKCS